MSHADVYSAVSAVVPTSHVEWPNDSAPPLPWALYYGEEIPVSADNSEVAVRRRWTVELYEKRRDRKVEGAVASALRERFGPVRRNESYVENDNMLMVVFTFSQIEGGFDD